MGIRGRLILLACVLIAVTPTIAQTVTGQLTGTVVDSAGGIVVGASVQITNEVTKQIRQFSTGGNGTLIFPDLVPGTDNIPTAQPGFKTFLPNGITVGHLETVRGRNIPLEVADVA